MGCKIASVKCEKGGDYRVTDCSGMFESQSSSQRPGYVSKVPTNFTLLVNTRYLLKEKKSRWLPASILLYSIAYT